MTNLQARRTGLEQRLQDLQVQAQRLNAEMLKVAGALELLQELIQERDGQAAPAVTHTTGDRVPYAQDP